MVMELEIVDITNEKVERIKTKATIVGKGYQHTPFIMSNHIGWRCIHEGEKCDKCNIINNFGFTSEYFNRFHEGCNGNILTSLKLLSNEFTAYRQTITSEDINLASNFINHINEVKIEEEEGTYYIDGKYFNDMQLRYYKGNIYWVGSSFYFTKVIRYLYDKEITEASFIIAYINKGYKIRFVPHKPAINISFKVDKL